MLFSRLSDVPGRDVPSRVVREHARPADANTKYIFGLYVFHIVRISTHASLHVVLSFPVNRNGKDVSYIDYVPDSRLPNGVIRERMLRMLVEGIFDNVTWLCS